MCLLMTQHIGDHWIHAVTCHQLWRWNKHENKNDFVAEVRSCFGGLMDQTRIRRTEWIMSLKRDIISVERWGGGCNLPHIHTNGFWLSFVWRSFNVRVIMCPLLLLLLLWFNGPVWRISSTCCLSPSTNQLTVTRQDHFDHFMNNPVQICFIFVCTFTLCIEFPLMFLTEQLK